MAESGKALVSKTRVCKSTGGSNPSLAAIRILKMNIIESVLMFPYLWVKRQMRKPKKEKPQKIVDKKIKSGTSVIYGTYSDYYGYGCREGILISDTGSHPTAAKIRSAATKNPFEVYRIQKVKDKETGKIIVCERTLAHGSGEMWAEKWKQY